MPIPALSRPFHRRRFLISLSAFVAICGLGSHCIKARAGAPPAYPATLSGGAPCGSCAAPNELTSKTAIPPPHEPGELLVLTGRLLQADGVTPAAGYVLFVYQTDATGYYNKEDDASRPRLRGWMKTGSDGRFEFRTIRPGAYPHRDTPAHIHAHVYGPHYPERAIADFWFKDDPRITADALTKAKENGEAPVIVPLTRDPDGVWRGAREVTLQPTLR